MRVLYGKRSRCHVNLLLNLSILVHIDCLIEWPMFNKLSDNLHSFVSQLLANSRIPAAILASQCNFNETSDGMCSDASVACKLFNIIYVYIFGYPASTVTPFTLSKKANLPKVKVEELHRSVTRFVVMGLHSFSTVESKWFR